MNNLIRLATSLALLRFVVAVPVERIAETQGVSSEERGALVALYRTMGGSTWTHQDGWLGSPGSECSWYGVICGKATIGEQASVRTVVSLDLPDNNLGGQLPHEISALRGLKRLNLRGNSVRGSLPDDLLQDFDRAQLEVEPLSLVNDFNEILVDVKNTSLLCFGYRARISEGGIVRFENKRCREDNRRQTREVYCEYREGRTYAFDRLGRFLDVSGFFAKNESPAFNRWSDVAEMRVTAKRNNGDVVRRSWSGPMSMSDWAVGLVLDGIVARTEWDGPAKEISCSSE